MVASFDYSFDVIGNLKSRDDNNESYTERFCYDALNRLTNSNFGAACTGGKTVSYDAGGIGNITSKSDAGTYSYPSSGSALPHAVSAITGTVDGLTNPQYSYDGDGNLTCISTGSGCTGSVGKQVSVTAFNMAATITQGTTSVSFVYDSEHKRIRESSTVAGTTTTTAYFNDPASGAMEEIVVAGSTVSWRDYLVADGAIIGVRTASESGGPLWGSVVWNSFNWTAPTVTWAYFLLDHLGSVAVVTDASGTVTQRLSYDPWGKERNPDGTDAACGSIASPTTRGFTNQEQLDQVCLVNLNARIYDPSIGKFLSPDPVVGNPFLPNGFNRYAYVLNNPLSLTDPTGLCFLGICNVGDFFSDLLDVVFPIRALAPIIRHNPWLGDAIVGVEGIICGPFCAATASAEITGFTSGKAGLALKAFVFSFVESEAFAGIDAGVGGLGLDAAETTAATALAKGAVGGLFSVASGGKFGSGFLAAGFGSLAGQEIAGISNPYAGTVVSAVAGGIGSVLGGGKFANGAVTGAFAYAAGAAYTNDNNSAHINTSAGDDNCSGCYDVAANGPVIPRGQPGNPGPSFDPLLQAATDAYNSWPASILSNIPPLSWLRGIFVHSAFAANVNALGPEYSAEVSYKDGIRVPYGTPGSVRADAIYGDPASPAYAVELKSGAATVTPAELRAYQTNLPASTHVYGIVEAPGR